MSKRRNLWAILGSLATGLSLPNAGYAPQPLDDGESARYRPNDTEGSELGFEEALHLVKIEYCDRTRAAYVEDLFNRKQIAHSVAVDLLEWVRKNPINS